ncbi:MAG: hypothetical protein IJ774_12225 [Selenomonadaceae bacterium]|nr:hypothetical protein [Selenomonadaceae bacterium]
MATREENLNKINAQLEQLTDEQLDQVAGGTFTPNKYSERMYNEVGIETNYHFFGKDSFFIKDEHGDNHSITYEQANWAVEYWARTNLYPTYETIINNCK